MRAIIVPDCHFPFFRWDAFDELVSRTKSFKPDYIIQVGDLYDLYSYTSHPKSHGIILPEHELINARVGAEKMWAKLKKASPAAACYQLFGNHDMRLRKRILRTSPEVEAVINQLDVEQLWRFPGVQLHGKDDRTPLVLNDHVFVHGYTRFGAHMRKFLKTTITGHSHRGGVEYMRLWDKSIYELNCGYLGDAGLRPFAYTATSAPNWTVGYGQIDQHGGRFILLE